jgi:hypothetical protein
MKTGQQGGARPGWAKVHKVLRHVRQHFTGTISILRMPEVQVRPTGTAVERFTWEVGRNQVSAMKGNQGLPGRNGRRPGPGPVAKHCAAIRPMKPEAGPARLRGVSNSMLLIAGTVSVWFDRILQTNAYDVEKACACHRDATKIKSKMQSFCVEAQCNYGNACELHFLLALVRDV